MDGACTVQEVEDFVIVVVLVHAGDLFNRLGLGSGWLILGFCFEVFVVEGGVEFVDPLELVFGQV